MGCATSGRGGRLAGRLASGPTRKLSGQRGWLGLWPTLWQAGRAAAALAGQQGGPGDALGLARRSFVLFLLKIDI